MARTLVNDNAPLGMQHLLHSRMHSSHSAPTASNHATAADSSHAAAAPSSCGDARVREVAWRSMKSTTLFVVTAPAFHTQWEQWLLPSLMSFWPRNALKVLVALEEQAEGSLTFARRIEGAFPWPDIYWAPDVPTSIYHGSGHILQQLLMFRADRAVNDTFIAFMDTDAVVTTTVHPEALFENGTRPIVRGTRGKPLNQEWWARAAAATEWAIGEREVGCFMTFFPVIIRTRHLAEMREFLERRHRMPFDEVFAREAIAGLELSVGMRTGLRD